MGSPWLRLEKEQIACLTRGLSPNHYPAKKHLLHSGQANRNVYIVDQGRVLIYLNHADGHEKTIMIAEQGCIFGVSSALFQTAVRIEAKAIMNVSAFVLPIEEFRQRVKADGELAWSILTLYERKLRALSDQINMLSFEAPVKRVAKVLLWLGQDHGTETAKGVRLNIKLTQQEIGDITGLSRVSVANAFSLLFQEGALVKGEKSLYITDWEKLQAISRGHEE